MVVFDNFLEVSCLYQHLCCPIEVKLDVVYCIFRYLHKNMSKNLGRITYNMIYDTTYENLFEVSGRDLDKWKYFYLDAQ